jgi:raffinose/stachyose/melibiose transport system substrate-binding protein
LKRLLKRVLPLAAALIMAGCSSPSVESAAPPPDETVKAAVPLRMLAYNAISVRATYLAFLEDKLPGIKLAYDTIPLDYYGGTLSSELLSGSGPDIIEVGGDTRLLASTGRLLDLTNEDFVSSYKKEGILPYSVGGKVYAVPLQSWFEGMYYNKDIFEKYGLNPPRNLEEFLSLHKALKSLGLKAQIMGAQSWEPLMKQSIALVNSEFYANPENAGFDAAFDKGEASLEDNWLPAVTLWSSMISEGCLTPDMLSYSYEQAMEEFALGKAAMWQSGPWSLNEILRINPGIRLGMFPIPGTREGEGWLVGGPGSALAVNANSKNKQAAIDVLAATATADAQKALLSDSKGLSYVSGVDTELGPVFDGCISSISQGHIYAPWTTAWSYGNPVVEAYGKALQEVLAGTKTVAQALRDADEVNSKLRSAIGGP